MWKPALVGASVTAVCILIPVVHFITAIPSAFIGGYMAGARSSCTPRQAPAIATLMALMLVVPTIVVGSSLALVFRWPITWILSLGLGVVAWFALAGTLGAIAGGASSRRHTHS